MTKKHQVVNFNTWRVCMNFPSDLYFKIKRKASKEGYTKRQLQNDWHVKDLIVSLLEQVIK